MNFYKDKRFYIPVLFFLTLELLFQLGIYTPFLKKNSYAANVSRISNHVIQKKPEMDPDILLLGTSVAYQGLSVNQLNSILKPQNLKVQSIAIPGSELIVQELATDKVLKEFKNVKVLIHVVEITMPWVQHKDLSLPTLAMVSEFNRIHAVKKVYEYGYEPKLDDISYILVRSFAYRRDLRDFLLTPNERLKHVGRALRNPNNNIADYENIQPEKISSYQLNSLQECMDKTNIATNHDPIPADSNLFHKKAIFDTCALAQITTTETKPTESTQLYFKRLKILYDRLKKDNIKVINVFAPYSSLISTLGGKERLEVWRQELEKINGANTVIIDLQGIFEPSKNSDYCFDLIHLNQQGMIKFSQELGEYLLKNLKLYP